MIRPGFPLFKRLVLPFLALLLLYVTVVGVGASVVYGKARELQAEQLVGRLMDRLELLARLLKDQDAMALMNEEDSWLNHEIAVLYENLPHLHQVWVQNGQRGLSRRLGAQDRFTTVELEPRTTFASDGPPPAARLLAGSDPSFEVYLSAQGADDQPFWLGYSFTRTGLLGTVEDSLRPLLDGLRLFAIGGAFSILAALGLAAYAGQSLRRLEAHLQTLYRSSSIAELAAGLVHDLRNPLSSIRAYARYLLIKPQEAPQAVEDIDRNIQQLEGKLERFLDFARIRNEPLTRLDPKTLLEDVARMTEPLFRERNLALHVEITSRLPAISVMPQALRDALLNLLNNAREASPGGGRVWLRARRVRRRLEISIEDEGEGLPEAVQARLFDPFFTTKESGHGLGLAGVKRTAEIHGGRVEAANRPGGGARFSIWLPIRPKASS